MDFSLLLARPQRRRPARPHLRLTVVFSIDVLIFALERNGARVSDGCWIEPLRHHTWPRHGIRRPLMEV